MIPSTIFLYIFYLLCIENYLCLYVLYRIINYAFNHVIILKKNFVYEPTKVSELVRPIFDRWRKKKPNLISVETGTEMGKGTETGTGISY